MKYSLEAVFHRKLKVLNVTKGQQGYIMGAFREACKELNIDCHAEPVQVEYVDGETSNKMDEDFYRAVRQKADQRLDTYLSERLCPHGAKLSTMVCDYCEAAKRVKS